jgi:hypothetical protein
MLRPAAARITIGINANCSDADPVCYNTDKYCPYWWINIFLPLFQVQDRRIINGKVPAYYDLFGWYYCINSYERLFFPDTGNGFD